MLSSSITANARLAPDRDPISYAESLMAEGRGAYAATLLEDLLARGRGGLLARITLAKAFVQSGEFARAVGVARETALLNPDAAIGALCLGETLLVSGKLAAAIGEFHRALRLDPHSARARLLLGESWLAAGEAEKALDALRAVPENDAPPELPARIAEAQAMRARPRSDPRYVRHLFDEFSTSYDERMLGQLAYGAPAILRELASMLGVADKRKYTILDLGCGTGLGGAAFADLAVRLDGIDLSPAMIGRARARGIYDSLVVGDLEEWLTPTYNLILAADTLVYLGDLSKVFAGVAKHLAPGGHFLFTAERSEAADFELGPKRRWRHSERYLRELVGRAGLDVTGLLACHPRTEAGVPVEGLAVAAKKIM